MDLSPVDFGSSEGKPNSGERAAEEGNAKNGKDAGSESRAG